MSALPLSTEQRAELMRRYPHEGNTALAAAFGLKPHQIAYWACNNFLKKTKAARSVINRDKPYGRETIAQRIREAVTAAGPAGLSITGLLVALPGMSEERLRAAVWSMARRRSLHRAGPKRGGRWFATAALADAYRDAITVAPKVAPAPTPKARPKPLTVTQAHGPAHLAGDAVAASAVPITHCPPVGPAPTAAPAAPGLFATLGLGNYVDEAPCSWVTAITNPSGTA